MEHNVFINTGLQESKAFGDVTKNNVDTFILKGTQIARLSCQDGHLIIFADQIID